MKTLLRMACAVVACVICVPAQSAQPVFTYTYGGWKIVCDEKESQEVACRATQWLQPSHTIDGKIPWVFITLALDEKKDAVARIIIRRPQLMDPDKLHGVVVVIDGHDGILMMQERDCGQTVCILRWNLNTEALVRLASGSELMFDIQSTDDTGFRLSTSLSGFARAYLALYGLKDQELSQQ